MGEYLTDGVCLYEIVERRSVRNYGRTGGTITTTVIRDVVSERAAANRRAAPGRAQHREITPARIVRAHGI